MAGYDQSETSATLTLSTKPNDVHRVFAVTALGSRVELEGVGKSQRVLPVSNSTISVYAVRNNSTTLAQRITMRGFDPDIIVAADGSRDARTIGAALDAAETGDVIVIKRDRYDKTVS